MDTQRIPEIPTIPLVVFVTRGSKAFALLPRQNLHRGATLKGCPTELKFLYIELGFPQVF